MNLVELNSLSETECFEKLKKIAEFRGYQVNTVFEKDCVILELVGSKTWSTKHVDPKIAYLSALGWLEMLKSKPSSILWTPRKTDIDLSAPSSISSKINVSDLDPEEIDLVYKKPRE